MELQFDETGKLTEESRLKRSALTQRILDRLGLTPNKPKIERKPHHLDKYNAKPKRY
jgi:hypothetical protein